MVAGNDSGEAKRVLIPLAEGFEEIEAVTVIDVLRRAHCEVRVAALAPGPVRGAHGIEITPDCALADVAEDWPEALVLPGGMPGTVHLREDERVLDIVRRLASEKRLTAAICAAPTVLATAGVERGHRMTSHPSVRAQLGEAAVQDHPPVVRSKHVFTSQGAGTAMAFALAIVEELCGKHEAARLAKAMVAEAPPG